MNTNRLETVTMRPAQVTSIVVAFLSTIVFLGCRDSQSPTAPATPVPLPIASSLSQRATQSHFELDDFNNFDVVLSCMNGESTHWEGSVHVTVDVLATPSGNTLERIAVAFGEDYFVERANGVRYFPAGPFPVHEHHLFGPVTVIAGTAAGAWRSASGDVLVLGFHAQFLFDRNGNPVLEKLTGACP